LGLSVSYPHSPLTRVLAPDTLFKFGDAAIFSAARPADSRRFALLNAVRSAGPMQFFCMRPGNTIYAERASRRSFRHRA
jgi:hypothetical protein